MIIENALTCCTCNNRIVSKTRHDFVSCSCGDVSVDGGQEYLRRVGNFKNTINHSWGLPDAVYLECAKAVEEAIESNRNSYGIANAVMRKLRAHNCVIAEGEQRVLMQAASNPDAILVVEPDGSVVRYAKVVS